MVGLAASEEDADRLRFFEGAGHVALLVMELHVLLTEVVSRFGGSTCVLARSHAEKEGEDNAAPNGVVTSIVGSDNLVVVAERGWRRRLGSFVGEPGPRHAVDVKFVADRDTDFVVSGGFMMPRNSADLDKMTAAPLGCFTRSWRFVA